MIQGIEINKHIIKGFGGFSNKTTFDFHAKGASLILGVNGAGKTTVLNSLYYSISTLISSISSTNHNEIGISQSTISLDKNESEILSRFNIDEINDEIGYRLLPNGQINIIGTGVNKLRSYFKNIHQNQTEILPVFRYFQTEKQIDNTVVSSQRFNKVESRRIGYNQHQAKRILIQEVTSFLVNQINIENQAKVDKKDLKFETSIAKYLRETLNNFTTRLYGEKVAVKVGESKYSNGQSLVFSKNNQQLEFLQLSSGEKYILSIVLELIYRIVTLNPKADNLYKIPGIVLIDEIDSHLHPKWQLTIINALENCFSEIQFIVTTHSPLIASSVVKDRIIALNNFDVIPNESIPNIYSGTADELLNKILFSDNQIDVYLNERKEINRLINELKFDEAEKKFNQLKAVLKATPQWIKDLEQIILFGKA